MNKLSLNELRQAYTVLAKMANAMEAHASAFVALKMTKEYLATIILDREVLNG